jgi:hypothetical protein
VDGRYLLICVADGVSAGEFSHVAAERAASGGTVLLCAELASTPPDRLSWGHVLDAVAQDIMDAGLSVLRQGELTRREVAEHMATTVLYAIFDLTATEDGHEVILLAVGDTPAWVLLEDGRWWPQQPIKNENDELYSASVQALPMVPDIALVPVRTYVRPGQALVLMTDGVGDPLGDGSGDGSGDVGRFLAEAWRDHPPNWNSRRKPDSPARASTTTVRWWRSGRCASRASRGSTAPGWSTTPTPQAGCH